MILAEQVEDQMTSWPSVIIALTAAGAVLAVIILRRRFRMVTVYGVSMEPTLSSGDRVLIRRCKLSDISRGDIVLLDMDRPFGWPEGRPLLPGHSVRTPAIKRVAALPGETIPEDLDARPGVFPGIVVPAGSLVVVGDNREASADSRQHGCVSARMVTGRMLRKIGGRRDPRDRRAKV